MRDKALWARLQAYGFPMSDGRSLATQIGAETVMTPDRAATAVDEYRRYVYLVATSNQILAPSPLIDRVWHQHLLDTRAYMTEFCPTILGKTLHHIPGRPAAHKDNAYQATLDLYLTEFGIDPPKGVWPSPEVLRDVAASKVWGSLLFVGMAGAMYLHNTLVFAILAIGAMILSIWATSQGLWAYGAPGDGGSGCGGGDSSGSDGCGGGCGGD